MKAKECFLSHSLGGPLALSAVATVATSFLGKKYHALAGVLWGVLSLAHGTQHYIWHQKKKHPDALSRFDKFLRTTEVAGFVPGRIRVYNRALAEHPELGEHIESCLLGIKGVKSAKANPITGSLLVTYDVDEFHKNPSLTEFETILSERAKIK